MGAQAIEPEEDLGGGSSGEVSARRQSALLLALGLNAWVICLLLPWLHLGFGEWARGTPGLGGSSLGGSLLGGSLLGGIAEALFCALPVAALGLGLSSLDRRPERARLSLLVAYPVVLGAVVASRAALVAREAYSGLGLLLGGLSLLAFLALAARACARPRELRPSEHKPRRYPEERISERATRLGSALLIGWSLGALTLIAVAPHLGGVRALEEAWGIEAAADGGVFATVLAVLLAAGCTAGVIGPGLRAQRGEPPRKKRLRARLIGLSVSALALGGWVLLRYLESQR